MIKCSYCFVMFERNRSGRSPRFCSGSCKQAHWRLVKNGFKRSRVSAVARSLSLRNLAGTGIDDSLPLRNATGTAYAQVDWGGENQ